MQALVDDALIKLRRAARSCCFRHAAACEVLSGFAGAWRKFSDHDSTLLLACRLLACVTEATLAKADQLTGEE